MICSDIKKLILTETVYQNWKKVALFLGNSLENACCSTEIP